jgi:hypothetical protein
MKIRQHRAAYICLVISCLAGFLLSCGPEEGGVAKAPEQREASRTSGAKADQRPYLISSLAEFQTRFNMFSDANGLKMNISQLEHSRGEGNNTFRYEFSGYLGLVGTLSPDNSVKGLTMIAAGEKDSLSTGTDFMTVVGGIIAACDPVLTADNRGDIIEAVGLTDVRSLLGRDAKSRIINGVKYWAMADPSSGIWFGAELPE